MPGGEIEDMPLPPGRQERAVAGANAQLNVGLAHHQAGRLREAESIYRRILAGAPRHFDAIHLLGVIALQTGRLDEARRLILEALALNPRSAPAFNNLGNVYLRLDNLAEALASFERAVQLQPGFGDGHMNLGTLLRRQGKLSDAAAHLKRAAAIDARSIQAQSNLGAVLLDLRDTAGAIRAFEAVVRLRPGDANAHANLGAAFSAAGDLAKALEVLDRALKLEPKSISALANRGMVFARLGRFADARPCFEQVLALEPNSTAAHYNLGVLLRDAGSPELALAPLRRAIELDSGSVEAQLALAQALHDAGSDGEAQEQMLRTRRDHPQSIGALIYQGSLCLERDDRAGAEIAFGESVRLQPQNADALYHLGNVLMLGGRVAEAREKYQKARLADPQHVQARWAWVMAQIPPVAGDVGEVIRSRSTFTRELRELNKWFEGPRGAEGYKAVGSTQPFYLAYQAQDNRELLARYGALCTGLMTPWQAQNVISRPIQLRDRARPIRVGIASAHIHDHSVWNAIVKGWIKHLDRRRFEVFLFNLGGRIDSETRLASQWVHHAENRKRGLIQWSQCIADSDLDILIYPEIGMDTMTVRLASQRLVPVQAAAWGHPETTGLPTIDFYLSAGGFEPAGAPAHYTERLVLLPHLGVCYEATNVAPIQPDLAALGLPTDAPLMLCPGMPFKYSPAHDDLWVQIARRTSPARLVFFRSDKSALSDQFAARLRERFTLAGHEFDRHVSFVPFLDRARYYGLMQHAQLFLDSPGFSGFNTAIQAIECGLPIVAFEGEFLRGRFASGILRRLGMDGLVAGRGEAYVDLVVDLMQDEGRRKQVREQINARRHLLLGDKEPIAELERFFDTIWRV